MTFISNIILSITPLPSDGSTTASSDVRPVEVDKIITDVLRQAYNNGFNTEAFVVDRVMVSPSIMLSADARVPICDGEFVDQTVAIRELENLKRDLQDPDTVGRWILQGKIATPPLD